MLTKSDLEAIGKLLDKKLDEKLDQKLDQKLNQLRKDINTDIGNLLIEGPLKTLTEHDRRIETLEKHVGLPTS